MEFGKWKVEFGRKSEFHFFKDNVMIRKLKAEDTDNVMKIWLNTNIEAHSFIPEEYWKNNFDAVKSVLPCAEVYVYEDKCGAVQGFIGLNGEHIEGLFIRREARSAGIGSEMLSFVKSIKSCLTLNVYQKNIPAVRFYNREGFTIKTESIDKSTGEKEYFMVWSK